MYIDDKYNLQSYISIHIIIKDLLHHIISRSIVLSMIEQLPSDTNKSSSSCHVNLSEK